MPDLISIAAMPLSEGKVALYALDRDGVVWKLIEPDGVHTGWSKVGPEPTAQKSTDDW
jgi:hypothetical protein